MYYVTGDTHGSQGLWKRISGALKPGDTIIITGDFGVVFWGTKERSEEAFYDFLEAEEYTVLFCDGNHESFPALNSYEEVMWNGGKAHRIRKNVLHLMRGEIYDLEGRHVFAMGGGRSFDKALREPGKSWWEEEMPCDSEYRRAGENLKKTGFQVDYIVTHTAPDETVEYLSRLNLGINNNATEKKPLTSFLRWIEDAVHYSRWYFGHFHVDVELWKNQYALLNGIRDLETGSLIKMRDQDAK